MIELNCTYGESKKILELGYDFSKICAVFSAKGRTMSHGLPFVKMIINPFLDGVGHLENLAHLKSLPYLLLGKGTDIDSITPIIPKGALEACLPEIKIKTLDCRFVRNIGLHTINLSYFFSDYYDCYEEIKEFKSAFEAFMWCHENHPEELKKKFNEVMA